MDSRNPYIKTFITKHNIILKDKIVYSDFYNNRNIEKPFTLTSENVRNDIRKIDFENVYSENNGRSKDVENYEMPQFATAYYYFLVKNERIPSPMEFVNEYVNKFCVIDKKHNRIKIKAEFDALYNQKNFDIKDFYGRMLRSYNSFGREVDLLLKLKEKLGEFSDCKVYYNLVCDVFHGIDIMVENKDKKCGIASFAGTRRSLDWKTWKDEARNVYEIKMFNLIAHFDYPDKNIEEVGDAFLYTDKAIDTLVNDIVAYLNLKKTT